jgi:hypothetical protein
MTYQPLHFNQFSGMKSSFDTQEEGQKYFENSPNSTKPLQHNKRTFNPPIQPQEDASVSIKSRFFTATIEAIRNTSATHKEKLVILQHCFTTNGTMQYAKLFSK